MAILEMKQVKVYQMRGGEAYELGIRKFQGWEDEGEKIGQFGTPEGIIEALYSKVYETNISVVRGQEVRAAEDLYRETNTSEHPVGWTGHSLSMSDIVQVGEKYFYCDTFGWHELK